MNLKKLVWNIYTYIDAKLKFPNLKGNGVGIQLGFDMSAPITSDLFTMNKKLSSGLVIGIDTDPKNYTIAQQIIEHNQLNIKIIQKGTFSEKGKIDLLLGEKSGWNQLSNIPIDSTVDFSDEKIEVEVDTLDEILKNEIDDIQKIQHINLTINGAEYHTLIGAKKLLESIKDLSLTVVAGRYDESGIINGEKDHKLIINYLKELGFTVKFKRIHQLFWWGFVTKLLFNRKWIYNQPNYGVVMACKGNHKLKWYQSFS